VIELLWAQTKQTSCVVICKIYMNEHKYKNLSAKVFHSNSEHCSTKCILTYKTSGWYVWCCLREQKKDKSIWYVLLQGDRQNLYSYIWYDFFFVPLISFRILFCAAMYYACNYGLAFCKDLNITKSCSKLMGVSTPDSHNLTWVFVISKPCVTGYALTTTNYLSVSLCCKP
jgi:hypothetical protein